MKFINKNGLEVVLKAGTASVRGVKADGDEVVVKFDDELAQSIYFLLDLDIFELEKLRIRHRRNPEGI